MKRLRVVFALVLGVFATTGMARAIMLPGQVTGYQALGCMMSNYTGQTVIVDQVYYQYTCNHGSQDPFRQYVQVMPCFGLCTVDQGRSLWHSNGPFTWNCRLLGAQCYGIARPSPTPIPTPTPSI